MLTIKKNYLYSAFVVILLTTEFFYIEVGGGVARIYHFASLIVVLFLHQHLHKLTSSKVFIFLSGFLTINVISALFAESPAQALMSLLSLVANFGISIAVALMLIAEKLNIEKLVRLLVSITIVSVFLSIIQVFGFKFLNVIIALSDSQVTQIESGFGAGFRTEANTFAKYLNVVFLIIFPLLLDKRKFFKHPAMLLSFICIGMALSLTRSALYGLAITLLFIALYYLLKSNRGYDLKRFIKLSSVFAVIVLVFSVNVGQFNEYASHKLANFFNTEEILEGGSAGFRLFSQFHLYEAYIATTKSLLIGNGWGQVYFDYGDDVWQAGGAEILVSLAYGGMFAGILYLTYILTSIKSCHNLATIYKNNSWARIFEGFMFAVVGLLVTGQINGSQIAPEYWLVFGVAIYCDCKYRELIRVRLRLLRVGMTK